MHCLPSGARNRASEPESRAEPESEARGDADAKPAAAAPGVVAATKGAMNAPRIAGEGAAPQPQDLIASLAAGETVCGRKLF